MKTPAGRNCSRDASPSTSRKHPIGTRKNNEKRSNFSENGAQTYQGKVRKGSERKDKKIGNRKSGITNLAGTQS